MAAPAWGSGGKISAWAEQVDEEEAEHGGTLPPVAVPKMAPQVGGDRAFPSLGDAVNIKDTKKDRKKRQDKVSLGTFMAARSAREEVVDLPTAPKARDPNEPKGGGLGGGFKDYGGNRGFGDRDRDRDSESDFGGHGSDDGPSRADAADDWGTMKKFVPSSGAPREERGGGFGSSREPRAEGAGAWGSRFEPAPAVSGGGRRGFDDRPGGFRERGEEDLGPSKADTEDRWSRRAPSPDRRPSSSGFSERLSERSSGGFEGRWNPSRDDAPSGAGSSAARPRLNLKPRSKELPDIPQPPAKPASKASSEAGSEKSEASSLTVQTSEPPRPRANPFGSAKPVTVKEVPEVEPVRHEPVSRDDGPASPPATAVPRPKVNPFGSARPREEVLKEKAPEALEEPKSEAAEDAVGETAADEEPPSRKWARVAAVPAKDDGDASGPLEAEETPVEGEPEAETATEGAAPESREEEPESSEAEKQEMPSQARPKLSFAEAMRKGNDANGVPGQQQGLENGIVT